MGVGAKQVAGGHIVHNMVQNIWKHLQNIYKIFVGVGTKQVAGGHITVLAHGC